MRVRGYAIGCGTAGHWLPNSGWRKINETKSSDPQKVALALEGMKYQGYTGEVTMRADNHQLLQPMYISTFSKAGTPGVKFDSERTGFGFRTEGRVEAADTMMPTTCKMERPR
jgi:branched-chain amino acid transport system substrate-binding protein